MPNPTLSLANPLAHKAIRQMAIATLCDRFMRGFIIIIINLIHHMTIITRSTIITKIRKAICINESVNTATNDDFNN